jgi:dimethylhistidine N-methyltransferase
MNRRRVSTHVDTAPDADEFLTDAIAGLTAARKTLPCKYLYDERGSHLFDDICELPEYYPTRTELAILERHIDEIADALGRGRLLIEYGSGSSLKSLLLLDHLQDLHGYVPIDISRDHLLAAAARLHERYPELKILPVCADYTSRIELPGTVALEARKVVFFPGSTIGNFTSEEALDFLGRVAEAVGPGGACLIGVDLVKDVAILEAAYDDAAGVTAAFNLNLLERMNRELDADFQVDAFRHVARWNPEESRVEMHLESLRDQTVHLGGRAIDFRVGETIWTESSHKFTRERFAALACRVGFEVARVWTDPEELFSVQLLRVAEPAR